MRQFLHAILLTAASCHCAAAPSADFLFMMECQGCHLSDGSGGVNAVPPMNNQVARFLTVAGGREFLARVPGVARSPLNNEEITAVLNWLLHRFGPADIAQQHPPYTVEEIAALREQPIVDVSAHRAELIRLIELQADKAP